MATVVKDLGAVTAYAYAVAGGYSGTEAEFEALLGNIAEDLSEIENLSVTVTTLPAGSSATASYNNGVLSLGIPKGDKGDKGDTGATGATGPQGIPGDVANLASAYSTSSTYGVGDYCIYNSQLYRCITPITTAETWTAAHWTAAALGDDVSNLKSALFNDEGTNLITSSTIRNSAGSGSNYITIDKTKLTMLWHLQISATVDSSAITLSSNPLNLNTNKEYVFFAHLKSLSDHNVSQGAISVQYLVDGQTPQYVTSSYALPFAQVMDGYVRGVFKPNRSTGYIRFVFNGMASGAKVVNLMIDQLYFGEMPVGYVPSEVYGAIKNLNNPVDKLYMTKDADYINADLLCWGDSLTAGAGGNGTTYPDVCASELGFSVLNCGVGGEDCNTIAARQGGNNVVIPAGPVNGTYAHLYDIFGYELAPLLQGAGNNSGREIIVNGLNCQLVRSSGNYVISGYSGSALAVPTLARFNGSDFKGKIVTIWIGTNGGSFPGTSAGIDMRIAWINSMIKHIGHDQYVILGLTVGEETATFYVNEENRMKQEYGNKYLPTRKYLIENGLTLAGITPTEQDTADIADGKVPTSLKSDSVHLNAYGYTAVGKLLANKIRSLGYV